MLYKTVILLSLFVLANSKILPQDRGCIYSYCGSITIGTKLPQESKSHSEICANLEIYPTNTVNRELVMKFSDMTYRVYASDKNPMDTKAVPIPRDSIDIENPFVYHPGDTGIHPGITVSLEEKSWIINMKLSVASLFDKIEKSSTYSSYKLNENVTIMTESTFDDVFEAVPNASSKYGKKALLPLGKSYVYTIEKVDGELLIKSISSVGLIDFAPFTGNGEMLYANFNQSLKLESTKRVSFRVPFSNKTKRIDLTTDAYRNGNGHQRINLESLMMTVKEDLENIHENIHENHITLRRPNVDKKYSVGYLAYRLKYLSNRQLKEIHAKLSNSSRQYLVDLFLQMLSVTGESSACTFLVDLIAEKRIRTNEASVLLLNMPKHVKNADGKLLEALHGLISDKTADGDVLKSSVLAMSSMIASDEFGRTILDEFEDRLVNSKNYDEFMLYVSAVSNLKINQKSSLLQKYATDVRIPDSVRSYAILGIKNDGDANGFLWNIFRNLDNAIEIRSTAMHVLIDPDFPEDFEKMYWHISRENDPDIKNLFYTKVKAIAGTTLMRYENLKEIAKRFLPHLTRPSKNPMLSSSYFYDYIDKAFGIGFGAQITHFGKPNVDGFMSIFIDCLTQTTKPVWDRRGVYINLRWNKPPFKLRRFEDLITSTENNVTVHISSVLNNAIDYLKTVHLDKINLVTLLRDLIVQSRDLSVYRVDQMPITEIVIPTDIGIPVVFFMHNSNILKYKYEYKTGEKLRIDLKYDRNENYGFISHNPVFDVWSGIKKVNSMKANLPLDVDMDFGESRIKFDVNVDNQSVGFQTYSMSQLVLKDGNFGQTIGRSCPGCKLMSVIGQDEEKSQDITFWETTGDSGIKCQMKIFDCHHHLSSTFSNWILKDVLDYQNKNFGNVLYMKYFLGLHRLWKMIALCPKPGACGIGFSCAKDEKNPITRISFNIESKQEETPDLVNRKITIDGRTSESFGIDFTSSTTGTSRSHKIRANFSSEYTICFDSDEKWESDSVNGKFTVAFGNSPDDGNCPETNINIKITGEPSQDQKVDRAAAVLNSCESDNDLEAIDCLDRITDYNKITYLMEYNNFTEPQRKYLDRHLDFIRNLYPDHFARISKFEPIKYNTIKLVQEIAGEKVGLSYFSGENGYSWENIRTKELLRPRNQIVYNSLRKNEGFMHNYDFCQVTSNYVQHVEDGIKYKVKYNESWATLNEYCDDMNACLWNVQTRKISENSEKLILRITLLDGFMEVHHEDRFRFYTHLNSDSDQIVHLKVIEQDKRILLNIKSAHLYILFDGRVVKMLYYNKGGGNCLPDETFEKYKE